MVRVYGKPYSSGSRCPGRNPEDLKTKKAELKENGGPQKATFDGYVELHEL